MTNFNSWGSYTKLCLHNLTLLTVCITIVPHVVLGPIHTKRKQEQKQKKTKEQAKKVKK